MDAKVTEESLRAGRYVVVRWVSRSSDVVLYLVLLWLWGLNGLVPAFVISEMFDFVLDFFGQKLWAFKNPDRHLGELFREFLLYLLVRGGNIALATGSFYLLTLSLGLSWLTAVCIVVPIFWTIGFVLYRWIFLHSVEDFLVLMKQTWRRVVR